MRKRKIAIVGSGIAGLGAAWMLRHHYDIAVYELNPYVGGHTHTLVVEENDREVPVDTGFIVFNRPNYPNLTALFEAIGVATRPSEMSFSVSVNNGEVEYAGSGLSALYAQRRRFFSRSHQGMVWDILRFNRACKRDLAEDTFGHDTVDEYLARKRLGSTFRNRYLLPMAAAIWSCPTQTMGSFPAASLARFFANHGLIELFDRPQWRTLVGGSHRYVKRLLADLGPAVQVNCGITRVRRIEQGVELALTNGTRRRVDEVIIASHADQALAMLADPSPREISLLSPFRYQKNTAILHSDSRLMPRDRRVWSSWNYFAEDRPTAPATSRVAVTYWMNRLQGLPVERDFFVTLNPLTDPHPASLVAEMTYEHPIFDRQAIATQPRLNELQGRRNTWFCGSYFGYGFHEDAFSSALSVARELGVVPAWQQAAESDPQVPATGRELLAHKG